MIEIKFSLQPKQKAFLRTVEETPITLYGGAKGGGKSKGIRDILLLRRFQHPGTHAGLFRRTYKELEGNHIRPLFKEHPALKEYWTESKKLLTLPNQSTLEFCHCENEADVELYQGREFEDLAIEEAGQWLESMFRTLHGSNRSATPGFKPRTLLTANPGGIGHSWLKRLFIERRFNARERATDYAFIQALVSDNPALLENDPDYVHRLNSEPNEALRRAYRFGDWDIFAGQFFGEIRREVHLIPAFPIPKHWTRFGSYDFGFNHPAAFGWFACDEDGNVFLYRELIEPGLRVDQYAKKLNDHPDTKDLFPIVGGHDCWAKKSVLKQGSPPTIAEEFQSHGITLSRAQIDRVAGAAQVRSHLAWQDKPPFNKPCFYIFDTCPLTYDCLARMLHDPNRAEDVLKVDAVEGDPQSGDDPYDMVRYALMTRPALAVAPVHKYARGTPEWAKQQQGAMEAKLQEEIDRQQSEERENDVFALSGMDPEANPLSYFLEKKRGA